jgi:hypothetical protein
MYVGVNGVARKVKKAYVGVNGVAKLFWKKAMDFNKVQIQTTNPLDEMASATNSNYVLFGGGEARATSSGTTTANKTIDAFDRSLTRTACADLSSTRSSSGGSSDKYAMFGVENSTNVDTYDGALSKTIVNVQYNSYGMPSGDTLNHCVFGLYNLNNNTSQTVACLNKIDLIRTNATALTITSGAAFDPAASSRFGDDWFCFGCGTGYMQHYDKNLTKQTNISFSSYSNAKQRMGVGTTKHYLICGGGQYSTGSASDPTAFVSSVFAVNPSLTFTSASSFNVSTTWMSACGNDECCMFATGATKNGQNADMSNNDYVYTYDDSLTKTINHASNIGVWTYGAINFDDRLFLPNGRVYKSSQNISYNSGVIDVWS